MNKVKNIKRNDLIVENNIKKLLDISKGIFSDKFPEQEFDSLVWQIVHLNKLNISRTNPRLYFTYYGTQDLPLPIKFTEIVKSWLLLGLGSNVKVLAVRLDTVRVLWKAIIHRRQDDEELFNWDNLSFEDINQTELIMREIWAKSTTYKRMTMLLAFLRFLESRSLIYPINYTIQTPRIEDSNRFTIAGQEESLKKLPTDNALEGLADIYHKYATELSDRLLICAIALLAVTGFRIGELLTLPVDCEVEEDRNGISRYGLRFYKEKPGSQERKFETRWITPVGAELVKKAIIEIKEITFLFREQAKLLEQNPDRFPLKGYKWNDKLSSRELADLLGFKNTETTNFEIKTGQKEGKYYYYPIVDVESYLLSRRVKNLWTLDRNDGTHQMLSETLLIAPKNFFHAQRGVINLLIEPVTVAHIGDFISGNPNVKNVFEKFGIKENNGNTCKITSHQFRHWINTIAIKGGLSTETLTRWMGRDNPKDTEAYIHFTQEEKINFVKEGIKNNSVKGVLSEAYFYLSKDERDIFLDGQIQAVHFTHLGICTHDFAVSPCKYHLNCVRGCPDYLRTKGNQKERQQLVQIKGRTQLALESALKKGEMAEGWVRHHAETIDGLNVALSVDDHLDIPTNKLT